MFLTLGYRKSLGYRTVGKDISLRMRVKISKVGRSVAALVVLLLQICSGCVRAEPGEIRGKAVAVFDGDTIEVRSTASTVRVRLYGIDAPERYQAFSERSKQALSDQVFQKNVKVVKHDTDRYGRLVGEVFVDEGSSSSAVSVNNRMVEAGLAWWYQKYAPNDSTLESLERIAREEKRGLWRDPNPEPPWNFRKEHRR